MKFAYDDTEPSKEVVACLYEYCNGPYYCLAVDTEDGRKVWFYLDGSISIQGEDWGDGEPVKKFYPGDSVTITF